MAVVMIGPVWWIAAQITTTSSSSGEGRTECIRRRDQPVLSTHVAGERYCNADSQKIFAEVVNSGGTMTHVPKVARLF